MSSSFTVLGRRVPARSRVSELLRGARGVARGCAGACAQLGGALVDSDALFTWGGRMLDASTCDLLVKSEAELALENTQLRLLRASDAYHRAGREALQASVVEAGHPTEPRAQVSLHGRGRVYWHDHAKLQPVVDRLVWHLEGLRLDEASAPRAAHGVPCRADRLPDELIARVRAGAHALQNSGIEAQVRATAELVRAQTTVTFQIADYEVLSLEPADQVPYLEAELQAAKRESPELRMPTREALEAELEGFGAMVLWRTRKLVFHAALYAALSPDDQAKVRHHEVTHIAQRSANASFLTDGHTAGSFPERMRARRAFLEGHAVYCAEDSRLYAKPEDSSAGVTHLIGLHQSALAQLAALGTHPAEGTDPEEWTAVHALSRARVEQTALYVDGYRGVERLARERPQVLARVLAEPWLAELLFMREGEVQVPATNRVEAEQLRAFNPSGHRLTLTAAPR